MNYDEMLGKLDETELEILERDLKEGHLQRYIERKKEFFKIKDKFCPICGSTVKEDCFVLIWGEPSIRKKAHFCGKDCLEYFIKNNLRVKSKENAIKTP